MSWTDTNTNRQLDPGELGAFSGFPRGLFPTVDGEASRPYSEEINAGVEHQLLQNLAVGVSYHRRQHRNGLGLIDLARPASAYTPENRTFVDPESGATEEITIYKLQPQFGALQDRLITNVDLLESDYNGVHLRSSEEAVEPLADARRSDAAEASRLRPQRDLHAGRQRRRLRAAERSRTA